MQRLHTEEDNSMSRKSILTSAVVKSQRYLAKGQHHTEQNNFSETQSKIFLRLVIRFSEQFGTDNDTLAIIRKTLETKLQKFQMIDAGVSFHFRPLTFYL